MNPKHFSLLTCGVTMLAFGCIAAMNFVVNPHAQYPMHLIQPMVHPTRAAKVDLMGQLPSPPAGLVLGSSRVMKLEPAYLEQKTGFAFFNAGVYYGKPEDFLALYRNYREQFQQAPKMVVLGLDPIALSDVQPVDGRLLGHSPLARQIPELISIDDRARKYRELLGWNQSKDSLKALKAHLLNEVPETPESFTPEGLLVYHVRERELEAGTYDFEGSLHYNKGEYERLYRGTSSLSKFRCDALRQLLAECRQADTRVFVFTTPLHPDLELHLEDVEQFPPFRKQATSFVAASTTEFGFEFHDLSRVEAFAGDPTKFFDGIHPFESNTRRIITTLFTSAISGEETHVIQ